MTNMFRDFDKLCLGSTIPIAVPVKEDEADKSFTFEGISGKNLFVRLFFLETCASFHHD